MSLLPARRVVELGVEDAKDGRANGGRRRETAPKGGKVLRAPDDGDDGRVDGEEAAVARADEDRGDPKGRRARPADREGEEAEGEKDGGEDQDDHPRRDGRFRGQVTHRPKCQPADGRAEGEEGDLRRGRQSPESFCVMQRGKHGAQIVRKHYFLSLILYSKDVTYLLPVRPGG